MIQRINCVYHTEFGKCNHLDRGRGFLLLGKECVMHMEFVGSCVKMIQHERPVPSPKPPKKRTATSFLGN